MNINNIECDGDICTWQPDAPGKWEMTINTDELIPTVSYDSSGRLNNILETSQPIVPTLKVKRIHPDAQSLKRAYEDPACVDISVIRLLKVENGIAYFGTGISMEIPNGYYVDLVPRSSCPKHGWTLANSIGKIDTDYRGEIIFALQPTSTLAAVTALELSIIQDKYVKVKLYDYDSDGDKCNKRIGNSLVPCITPPTPDDIVQHLVDKMTLPMSLGQFSIVKKVQFELQEVDELSHTKRGDGAFGSSDTQTQ